MLVRFDSAADSDGIGANCVLTGVYVGMGDVPEELAAIVGSVPVPVNVADAVLAILRQNIVVSNCFLQPRGDTNKHTSWR